MAYEPLRVQLTATAGEGGERYDTQETRQTDDVRSSGNYPTGHLICGSTFAASISNPRLIVTFANLNLKTLLGYTTALSLVTAAGGSVLHNLSSINALVITFPADRRPKVLASLLSSVNVLDVIDDLLAFVDNVCPILALPSGEEYYWDGVQIQLEEAHRDSNGQSGSPVTVAVLDTGIDVTHFGPAGEFSGKNAGGYNATNEPNTDLHGHGTHMAGIIGALVNNWGIIGVAPAPQVKLAAVKVGTATGAVLLSDVLEGLDWISQNGIKNGIRIVNISLGFWDSGQQPAFSGKEHPLRQAIRSLYDQDVILVASTGNRCAAGPKQEDGGGADCRGGPLGKCDSPLTGVLYPAAYSEVIAVAATYRNGGITDYSLSGMRLVGGPGIRSPLQLTPGSSSRIFSTNMGGYGLGYGTSPAAALVTGAVALAKWLKPDLTPQEARSLLQKTAMDLNEPEDKQGAGEINVWKMIDELLP